MAVSTLAHSILSISILHHRLKSLPSLHAFAGAWPGNEDNKNNGKRSAWNRIPTQADQNRYNRLRNNTNPITMTHDYFSTNFTVDRPFLPKFKFVYRGVSGLGHRLVRMSAMYHTARIYKILHLHVSWGWDCGEDEEGNPDIFDHLFGLSPMLTDPRTNLVPYGQALPSEHEGMWKFAIKNEELRIVNGVPGYKLFSACEWLVNRTTLTPRAVLEKTVSDEQFYRQLFGVFRFRNTVQRFVERHAFAERRVLGIHVRAGNGEDFKDQKRGFHRGFRDLDLWIRNVADSIQRLVQDMQGNRTSPAPEKLPPLLFVATDDHEVLDKLANATSALGFETLGFPQHRLEHGKGVTFTSTDKSTCHATWVAQFTDAALLGVADAVVAGRYSSFTQSLPLVNLLADSIRRHASNLSGTGSGSGGKDDASKTRDLSDWPKDVVQSATERRESGELYQNRIFCESNTRGDELFCYDDYFDWLYAPHDKGGKGAWPPHSKEVQYPCQAVS